MVLIDVVQFHHILVQISELYIVILHISGVSLAASYASNVIFANLFSEQVLSTATGNMITEKQVLTVKSPAIDSKLNGLDYTSTLTLTLFDRTPQIKLFD